MSYYDADSNMILRTILRNNYLQYKYVKLTKHIKQEPVSHIALFDNGVDYFPADESETYV